MGPDPRRVFAVLIAILLLLPAIAACGGGDDDEDPTATTGGSSAVETASTAISGQPTTLSEATEPADETETPGSDTPAATATPAPTSPGAATSTTSVPATVAPGDSGFAYGWNVALRGDADGAEHNARVAETVLESGFGWVRFQVEWSQFERADGQWDPLGVDNIVNELSASGIKILIVVAKAPDWALDPTGERLLADYEQFTEMMAFVADRYKVKVQAWEIWNEQNLAHEVNGTVRVEDYVDLLRAGHRGVRLGDPNATVVFGGLTPNGVNDPEIAIDDLLYLQQIYAVNDGEISQYFDIMGMHVSSTHNPPDTMWPDNPSDEEGYNDDDSFYFRRAEQLRQVMVDNGDEAKPTWITEFGWTTENQAAGYEYGVNNTEEEVADYLVRSFEIATTEWDFVTGMFVWNLNWTTLTTPDDEKYPWSAVTEDWEPRPAFKALRDMPKE